MLFLRVLILCALAPVACADLFIEMTTTMREGERKKTVVTQAWFAKDRAANKGIDGTKRVIRFDRELIWDVDPSTRRYTETTFATMRQLQKDKAVRQKAQAEKMRAMLKDPKLDQATRDRIKQLLQTMSSPRYSIVRGSSTEVLGHSAVRYEVKINGKPFMTVWATAALGNVAEFNRLQTLSGSMQADLMDQLRKIRGVWLKWQTADGQRVSVATKIATDDLGKEVFDIPAGFKKR